MKRPKLNLLVLDPSSGRARPLAWVTIYQANTVSLAPLYADDDVAALTNPIQANALGQVAVRVNPGIYDISMTWDGATPTVVEDVVAWSPDAAQITEPGDIIIGGPDGGPIRLPAGDPQDVLLMEGAFPDWQKLRGGHGLPTGVRGSLVVYDPAEMPALIPPGPSTTMLVMAGGMPTWVTFVPSGTPLPINQRGDLLIGATTPPGEPARLPIGAVGRVLTVIDEGAGVLQAAWSALPNFVTNPMTALGDLIVGGAAGVAERLPIGTVDQVLRVGTGGQPVWGPTTGRGTGQCRLRLSGANLWLQPWNGNKLWIGDRLATIPSGGVLLPATGLIAGTVYYIYAWMPTPTTIQLEASTTGYDEADGLFIKNGDVTRTLVGMARPIAGPAWIDTVQQRLVLSWFQRQVRAGRGRFSADRTTTSPTQTELHPEIRVEFLSWSGTIAQLASSGTAYATTPGPGNAQLNTLISLDGVIAAERVMGLTVAPTMTLVRLNIGDVWSYEATEGYHYVTLMGAVGPPATLGTWVSLTQLDVLMGG